MEYNFNHEDGKEILKVISEEDLVLSGFCNLSRTFSDKTSIHDYFYVVSLIKEEQDKSGKYYKWYEIDKRRIIINKEDNFADRIQKVAAKIDYLRMILNIEESFDFE